jgi:hypothetical protein
MIGKSIMREPPPENLDQASPSLLLDAPDAIARQQVGGEWNFFQPASNALQHGRFRGFDSFKPGKRFRDASARHDDDAVAVANNYVAGRHEPPAADDGQADAARPAFAGRVRDDSPGKDWKAKRFEIDKIANQTIGHKAGGTAIAGNPEQQVANHGGASKAAGRSDKHIRSLALGDRGIQREIIGGPAIAGERDAEQTVSDNRLDKPVERASAAHRIDYKARGNIAEPLERSQIRPLDSGRDG